MKRAMKSLGAAGVFSAIMVAGCAGERPLPGPAHDELGTIMLALSGDVGGYQIDAVAVGGGTSVSQFVSVGGGVTAQTVFTVGAGDYTVRATPAKSPGVPEPSCRPVSAPVTVYAGLTSEVSLVARCFGTAPGRINVVVGTDSAPVIRGITLSPPRPVAPCEKLVITADIFDPESEPLRIAFAGLGGPGTGTFTLDEPYGTSMTFTGDTEGSYIIEVSACDNRGCTTAELSVFVEGRTGTCTVSCDDGDPCTVDEKRDDDGVCTHDRPPNCAFPPP
jgi:hypothetical protein